MGNQRKSKYRPYAMRTLTLVILLTVACVVRADQDDTDDGNKALCRIECAKTNPDEADKLIDILCNCATFGVTSSMSDGATTTPGASPTTTVTLPTTTAAPSPAPFKHTTQGDICDYLCSVGMGGDACLCSNPALPGRK